MVFLDIISGEALSASLTITDAIAGTAVDVSSAVVSVKIGTPKGEAAIIIPDTALDKTAATSGVIEVPLTAAETSQLNGSYIMEVNVEFAPTNIIKNRDIVLRVTKAL